MAVTDNMSAVYYDPINRPGVSNLVDMYSAFSGKCAADVCMDAAKRQLDTGRFKCELADLIVERLRPISGSVRRFQDNHSHVDAVLRQGARQAQLRAEETMVEVRRAAGLC